MSLLSRLAVQAARAYGILSSNPNNVSADYLVVAGGGGGAGGTAGGGGGGAGGMLTSTATLSILNTYSIAVGAGGNGGAVNTIGSQGNNSSISGTGLSTITSTGGGYGGYNNVAAGSGGSGGGGGGRSTTNRFGGAGTSGQGYAGGDGLNDATNQSGAGGGGAGAVGGAASGSSTGGAGGNGSASSISGSSVTYAGGGGGAGYYNTSYGSLSNGGLGGSGGGGTANSAGTVNLGGGGGGGGGSAGGGGAGAGAAGGSGIVIISYTSATPKFVGGTITTSGGKQIHTFTSSGTLSPITPITASYLVVAGGGGSGSSGGGGGGAGGLLTSSTTLYSGATYVVTVGGGGAGSSVAVGGDGSNSVLSGTGITTITSTGGGGGGHNSGSNGAEKNGRSGGSGGGGAANNAGTGGTGGTGTSGQGNNGGIGTGGVGAYPNMAGGGGGGAGAVGAAAVTSVAGAGGVGSTSSISGTSTYYAGGGGGSGQTGSAGAGGLGGGGAGSNTSVGVSGTANTGGGGGGANTGAGGSGGSGIVIISYAGSQVFNGGLVTSSGGNTIHTFTSTGALTPLTNNLNNSLRFRSSATAYLSRTFASTGTNNKIQTFSAWVKRGLLSSSTGYRLMGGYNGSANYSTEINFINDNLRVEFGGSVQYELKTTQVFRDPSAWYHIVVAIDTTQATSSNRVKMYVNGNQITAFATANYPAQNDGSQLTSANANNKLGASWSNAEPFDGYMADINFIDGQALEPYYFGNNDANGVWKPIQYKGTFGTNGFYLPFTTNTTSSYAGSFSGSQNLQVAQNSAFDLASSSWTIEGWYLWNGNTSDYRTLFAKRTGGTGSYQIYVDSGNTNLKFWNGSTVYSIGTMPINSWTHIAAVHNGTTLTIYMNGVSIYSNSVTISNITSPFYIGFSGSGSGEMFTGNISNFRLVKGTAVYTSNFTVPTSALTNISGTSLLTLQNSTIIDNSSNAFSITNNGTVVTSTAYPFNENVFADNSGNNNNWIGNNIQVDTPSSTTYDAMLDVPTNTSATVANYCVLNPLALVASTTPLSITNGNLKATNSGTGTYRNTVGTFGVSSGKWYWELQLGGYYAGVINANVTATSTYIGDTTNGWCYNISNGNVYTNNTSTAYGNTLTSSDILGVALDMDNGKIYFSKNGTWQNSGNPATSTNPAFSSLTGTLFPAVSVYDGFDLNINFGQRPFTYTPPTGYVALNTYNLPTPTILQGNKYMDATLWTGTGVSNVIVNQARFKPDFVWAKSRSTAYDNVLDDSVRGVGLTLISNTTGAEVNEGSAGLTAFNSNGFTIGGASGGWNNSGSTYVGWQWQAGQGTNTTNTAGSITSTVSVNTTAGFSVVTYTGSGAAGTVGHGLGVAPKMVIAKSRSQGTGYNWVVYHTSIPATQFLRLNTTDAVVTASTVWNNTAPTSTVFSVGTDPVVTGNGQNFVAYCFAEIAGFSKFGSYTGNGSTNGPFVYLGFRPKFIMIKRYDALDNWYIFDSARSGYNYANDSLSPNLSDVEYSGATYQFIDLLSNGFKLRDTYAGRNASGGTYIFMAFAENTTKISNAR